MTYLSLTQKLKILLDVLFSFKFILIFVILLLILTFLYAIKKISSKKYILLMISSFIILFAISITMNYKVLSNTFDNFTNIFFGNIYFPSIYVYIGVLVISLIVFITSMLSKMLKKIYKIINGIMFVCNNILFIIVLNIIAKNKIDIFSTASLYTNTSLVAILEISMNLFILWVLSLIVIYATNCICDRIVIKKKAYISSDSVLVEDNNYVSNNDNVVMEAPCNISLNNPITDIEGATTYEEENNIIKDVIPDTLAGNDVKKEDSVTFEDILNGNIGAIYYDNNSSNDLSYDIVNPQEIYEEKYNSKVEKNNIEKTSFQDIVQNIDIPYLSNTDNNIYTTLDNDVDKKLDMKKLVEDRLTANTVSLNDLSKEDSTYEINDNETTVSSEKLGSNYTIDDYKKAIKMLNGLKIHTSGSSVSLEDAVTLSLISNYSVDDCVKFREILESNLN